MQITVKLYSSLKRNRDKTNIIDVPNKSVISDVIELMNMDKNDIAIILINDKNADINCNLYSGDILSFYPLAIGG